MLAMSRAISSAIDISFTSLTLSAEFCMLAMSRAINSSVVMSLTSLTLSTEFCMLAMSRAISSAVVMSLTSLTLSALSFIPAISSLDAASLAISFADLTDTSSLLRRSSSALRLLVALLTPKFAILKSPCSFSVNSRSIAVFCSSATLANLSARRSLIESNFDIGSSPEDFSAVAAGAGAPVALLTVLATFPITSFNLSNGITASALPPSPTLTMDPPAVGSTTPPSANFLICPPVDPVFAFSDGA